MDVFIRLLLCEYENANLTGVHKVGRRQEQEWFWHPTELTYIALLYQLSTTAIDSFKQIRQKRIEVAKLTLKTFRSGGSTVQLSEKIFCRGGLTLRNFSSRGGRIGQISYISKPYYIRLRQKYWNSLQLWQFFELLIKSFMTYTKTSNLESCVLI